MNQPSTVEEYRTEHMTMWLEPPDVVCMRTHGHIEAQDMLDVAELLKKHTRGWPYLLLFVDQTEQVGISAEARRAAATAFDSLHYRGTVFCGGSFALRTIGQMVMTIVNRVRGGDNPTKFFKTPAEGRQWIEERRRALRSSLSASSK